MILFFFIYKTMNPRYLRTCECVEVLAALGRPNEVLVNFMLKDKHFLKDCGAESRGVVQDTLTAIVKAFKNAATKVATVFKVSNHDRCPSTDLRNRWNLVIVEE